MPSRFRPAFSAPIAAGSADQSGIAAAKRPIICRRVIVLLRSVFTILTPALNEVPWFARRPPQQFRGFRIADDFLLCRVPTDFSARAKRNIPQVRDDG